MSQGSEERDENELLVPSITSVSTPESVRKRPAKIVIKRQSSRHWDSKVEDHTPSLTGEPSLEDILSPSSKPSTLGAAATHGDVSNQLWEATLSPKKENRKQLISQLSSSRDIDGLLSVQNRQDDSDDDQGKEEGEDNNSVDSTEYQKLLYAALDFEKDALNTPMAALASSLNHRQDPSKTEDVLDEEAVLPRHRDGTLQKWRRMVLCMVHLRFADCAGQQEDSFHTAGLFPMATTLGLGESENRTVFSTHKKSKPGDTPTRRATLFGSIVGIYRSAIQEGVVSLFHCIGDDKDMISQALRVRKSQVMHRVQKDPLNIYDLRPDTPKQRTSLAATQLTGLLSKLAVAKTTQKKNAAARAKVAKDMKKLDAEHGIDKIQASGEVIHYSQQSHDAHLKLVKAEQRAMRNYERKQRMHDTSEFFLPRQQDIFSILRRQYDPEGLAHPANRFYTAANLLRREALRFDERVQFLLRTIWKATDVDNSGAIDKTEYFEMHGRILCALLGRGAGDSSSRAFLAMEDWDSDSQGYRTLNRRRLEDCYFTLADRFTANIEVTEYTNFLNRLLGRMVNVDSEGQVHFKAENQIFEEGDRDPLLDENSVFQFISAEERAKTQRTTIASVVTNKVQKKRTNSLAAVAASLTQSRPHSASNNNTPAAPSSARGAFRTQRSRSCSEVSAALDASKRKSVDSSGYHDENVEVEPSERDLARWRKLFILAGCSEEGSTTDSRETAIESLRSYRSTLVVDVFEDITDPNDRGAVDEDLETFLEVEFELPGHSRKRQSLASKDNDIFAELLAYLPFQCFRSFDEFCTHLHRRRRMVVASRKVEHRTTFHGAIAAAPGSPPSRSHSAGKAEKRRPSSGGHQRNPSSTNRPSSASTVHNNRPSSASPAINSPSPREMIADRVRGSVESAAPPPPDPAIRMFSRDKLVVNTSKAHHTEQVEGEWRPSLSPLPGTPLLRDLSRKKPLDQVSHNEGTAALVHGLSFEDEMSEDEKRPLISARSFGNDEDEIIFSFQEDEANNALLSNSHEHSDDLGSVVASLKQSNSPPPKQKKKKKQPYSALPTKHLPKYRALYNFVPYEERHLAVHKGDILFAIPDLDGEPLTEDGWTYCMLEGNIEIRGYVPDTFILFLSPDVEDTKNKYHIALIQPPKERLYDIRSSQLFKIDTQLAREQQEQQIENQKVLNNLTTMSSSDIKAELMKKGLDVKGNRDVLADRLQDQLRDKGFDHGETVDYQSEGGTRHRAVIIHSSRSDPSVLNRQPSLNDSSKVSTLPSISNEEEESLRLGGSDENGGSLVGGGSIDIHNLAKSSLEEEGPENDNDDDNEKEARKFSDEEDGHTNRGKGSNLESYDENNSRNRRIKNQNSDEEMNSLKELLLARSRKSRSGVPPGGFGRLLYPTGDWNLKFPGYNFDAEILLRQRGVEAFKQPPDSETKHYGTGVRIGSNYPAAANIFHNGVVRSDEASLQAAARFPSRLATVNMSRPASAIDRPSARLAGNPLGRPFSAGTGLRAARNELTPSRVSIDGTPAYPVSSRHGPASCFGPKGTYQNTLSQSWQPSSNNELHLLYLEANSKTQAPRTFSSTGGGYYGTPDHKQSLDFQNSSDQGPSFPSQHSTSFLANFGVDGDNEGDPPAHVMPPSFWVYGSEVHEMTPEALATHEAQVNHNTRDPLPASSEVGRGGVITIPSRVPILSHSSTTDSSHVATTKSNLGLFDKKNSIPKNDLHRHHPEFNSSSLSQFTPQLPYAPQSTGVFHSSPSKKKKKTKTSNQSGSRQHKYSSKSHHHDKDRISGGPFTDPRPRPRPDDVHLFPWRQRMWDAQERAQKKEEKQYAATRALVAENDKCQNAPLLLKTKSHSSNGTLSTHTPSRHPDIPKQSVDKYSRPILKTKSSGMKTKRRTQQDQALVVGTSPFSSDIQHRDLEAYQLNSNYIPNNLDQNKKQLTYPRSVQKMELVNKALPKVMIGSSEYPATEPTPIPQSPTPPQAMRSAYMQRRPASGNRLGPFESRIESRCWNNGLATREMALEIDNIKQTELEAKRAERDQNYVQFGVPKNYKFPIASKEDKAPRHRDSCENSEQKNSVEVPPSLSRSGMEGSEAGSSSAGGKLFSGTYLENSVYSQESKLGSLLGLDDDAAPSSNSLLEVDQWR